MLANVMLLQVLSMMLLPFRVGFSAMARCNMTVVKYSSKANAIGSPMRLLHERARHTCWAFVVGATK